MKGYTIGIFSCMNFDFLSAQVELHYTSLNKGDVFILDEGMTIHCWNGSQCSRTERMKVIFNSHFLHNSDFDLRMAPILNLMKRTQVRET